MLLKTRAVTLLLMGLLELASTFTLNTPKDCDAPATFSGFTFVSKGVGGVSMNATCGQILNYSKMHNITKWLPTFGDDFNAITQTMEFPHLNVLYKEARGLIGPFRCYGNATANLELSKFNITLNAKKTDGDCRLQVKIVESSMTPVMDMSDLGIASLFFVLPELSKGLLDAVVENLKTFLSEKLTKLVLEDIARKMNINSLCNELINSTPAKYPQPDLN